MGKTKAIIKLTGIIMFMFSNCYIPDNCLISAAAVSDPACPEAPQTKPKTSQTETKSTQTKTKTVQSVKKPAQTKPKTVQKSTKPARKSTKPAQKSTKPVPSVKPKETGIIVIGTQTWAEANLNVSTFRNGDSIPRARTNDEWKAAGESGKPAWCYYNNDPKNGPRYGKLYNWYAVNDPRGLAPAGWSVPEEADWGKLIYYLGGPGVAGDKMKSISGWNEDYNGHNQSGFNGLPGGYRDDIGSFYKIGNVATWWSSTESKANKAIDFYLSRTSSADRSISPKQLGESVRCIRK